MNRGRRRFLGNAVAGGAVLTMPAFLAGCGVLPAIDMASPPPPNPYLDWFGIDESVLQRTLRALTANGADHASLYFQHRRTQVVTLNDGEAAQPDASILQGVGMRVDDGDTAGFGATEDLTIESLQQAAAAAARGLAGEASPVGRDFTTAPPGQLYVAERAYADIGAGERLALLSGLDERLRAADPSIDGVALRWRDVSERVLIATADGHIVTDERPLAVLSVQVMATRDGVRVSGFADLAARAGMDWFTAQRLQQLADMAIARTLVQFEARQPPPGALPVVFAPGVGGVVLHEAVGHAFEADFAGAGGFRPGDEVASDAVSLVDEPLLPAARGALAVDDEGVRGDRTVLVDGGTVRNLLHNRRTAARAGAGPTGNGRCQSYRHAPLPRMTCTYLDNGGHAPDDIVAAVTRGILVETVVDGQVDVESGDFAVVAKNGWLLENGKKTMPLRDLRVSGNGRELLRQVQMAGNDRELAAGGWVCGKLGQRVPVSPGSPTMLVGDLRVETAAVTG